MDPPDDDIFSPPPSYSEQEFDTKISQATDLSLQSSRWETFIDEDGWPRYDPAMFEEESTPSMKGKEYSAFSELSLVDKKRPLPDVSIISESWSADKKRPLPDITPMKPTNNAGPSNIPKTAPLHIAKKSISKAQEAALETRANASQFAPNPLEPEPNLTLENPQNLTTSMSDLQTADVPLYSLEHPGGVPDKVGDIRGALPEQQACQSDSLSEDIEETESSETLIPEPSNVSTSTGQRDDFRRTAGYPAAQYIPHRQSLPPQNFSRISPPELQRNQFTPYVPAFSQPPYQPHVTFNPNMAYGAPTMASGPPPTIRPRQPTHKVSFPLQYDPHTLYNSSVSSRLGAMKTTPAQPSYPQYQQTRFGNNQNFVPTNNTSLNPMGRQMRHSSARPLSTFSTMSDTSYGDAGATQYSSYSTNSSHPIPENQQWYINR